MKTGVEAEVEVEVADLEAGLQMGIVISRMEAIEEVDLNVDSDPVARVTQTAT